MDFKYTWQELKAIQDRIAELGKETDAIVERGTPESERERYNSLWDERHTLEEKRDAMYKFVIPEVGMPCTVIYFSDRSAATVIEVRGAVKKEVVVQQCGVYSGRKVFTYRRNGRWVEKGTTVRDWGTLLGLGFQENYYDREF